MKDAGDLANEDEARFFQLFVDKIEPALAKIDRPIFSLRIPLSQGALARPSPQNPKSLNASSSMQLESSSATATVSSRIPLNNGGALSQSERNAVRRVGEPTRSTSASSTHSRKGCLRRQAMRSALIAS